MLEEPITLFSKEGFLFVKHEERNYSSYFEIENNNIKVKFETIIATLRLHEEMTKLNEIAAKGNWERIFDVINKNERKLEELIKKYNDL